MPSPGASMGTLCSTFCPPRGRAGWRAWEHRSDPRCLAAGLPVAVYQWVRLDRDVRHMRVVVGAQLTTDERGHELGAGRSRARDARVVAGDDEEFAQLWECEWDRDGHSPRWMCVTFTRAPQPVRARMALVPLAVLRLTAETAPSRMGPFSPAKLSLRTRSRRSRRQIRSAIDVVGLLRTPIPESRHSGFWYHRWYFIHAHELDAQTHRQIHPSPGTRLHGDPAFCSLLVNSTSSRSSAESRLLPLRLPASWAATNRRCGRSSML